MTQHLFNTAFRTSFGQDITGSIFGYGSVTFEIASGDDLSFRAIEDLRTIRALVDRTASNDDGLGGGDRRASSVHGDLTQWQQVRDEIRAIRSSLEE